MRLVGVRQGRRVSIAVLIAQAVTVIADVDDFYADLPRYLGEAGRVTAAGTPVSSVVLAPPVPPSGRVLCVGLNYRAHAAEGSFEVPQHPVIFGRWTASLTVSGTPVPATPTSTGSIGKVKWP
jgi:2-keto-4-pentenoate hydratase/2-oxohepta-3-ene-1,7-dioic acid hydratase in catechol pathway